jgi:hypothetical protein
MAESLGVEVGLIDAPKMEGIAKPNTTKNKSEVEWANCFGRCLKGRVCNIGVITNLHNLGAA